MRVCVSEGGVSGTSLADDVDEEVGVCVCVGGGTGTSWAGTSWADDMDEEVCARVWSVCVWGGGTGTSWADNVDEGR